MAESVQASLGKTEEVEAQNVLRGTLPFRKAAICIAALIRVCLSLYSALAGMPCNLCDSGGLGRDHPPTGRLRT